MAQTVIRAFEEEQSVLHPSWLVHAPVNTVSGDHNEH